MHYNKIKILVVEDDVDNTEILTHILEGADYEVVTAEHGKEALDKLEDHPDTDVIVLDRMMPVMDGMGFLSRVKADEEFREIPVIMQTAADELKQIEQGISAGVYYYLTKPYSKRVLLAVIKAAVNDRNVIKALYEESERMSRKAKEFRRGLMHMQSSFFEFNTPLQARRISVVIASCFPSPRNVVMGFTELMINAIEHGNLQFTFEEKKNHLINGTWEEAVELRLSEIEQLQRKAKLELQRFEREIIISIEDEGDGFDWERFMSLDPNRADAPNGRGIYLAGLDFDKLEYKGKGNRVVCVKRI